MISHLQVMVAESLNISRETYFAIVLDRDMQGPVLVGSPDGGVDIEEVAASTPEKIFKVNIHSYEVEMVQRYCFLFTVSSGHHGGCYR